MATAAKTKTPATQTPAEDTTPAPTGADARAARLANKRGAKATATPAPRPITPAPKPTAAKTGAKKVKPEDDPATAQIKADEAEAKRKHAEAEAEKKAEAKRVKDAERAEKKRQADEAKAQRDAARKPTIDFKMDDYPVTETTVLVADLIGLPEMVGANPDAAFVRNVKAQGVIEPVTLIREDENDQALRIAGGRRRIRAASLGGVNEVPARIFNVGEKKNDIVAALTVTLNALRADNFAADVQALEFYRERYPDMPMEKVAREIGVPYGTLKKRARLLGLRPEIRQLLYSGALKHTVVVEISGMETEQQDQLLRIFRESGKLTHADILAVRNPEKAAAKAAANGAAVDVDALLDGPQVAPTIPDTGDLTSDLLGFLETVAEGSGVGFSVDETGIVTFTRGDQVIQFQAAVVAAE